MHAFMIGSIQNIKIEAFGSLQRGFYGIPYIGYFIAADVLHHGMSMVKLNDECNKIRMNDALRIQLFFSRNPYCCGFLR